MKSSICSNCGDLLPADRPLQSSPLCGRDECWKAFCIRWVDRAIERGKLVEQDQCLVWAGPIRKAERHPRVRLRDSAGAWRMMRVADAVRLHRGMEVDLHAPLITDSWCDTGDCQNPDHHKLRYQMNSTRQPKRRRGDLDLSRVKLPFGPIQRMTNELRARYPEMEPEHHMVWRIPEPYQKLYDRSWKSGKISVLDADAYCCDVLEMHPTAVYGWDFYTVGEEVS